MCKNSSSQRSSASIFVALLFALAMMLAAIPAAAADCSVTGWTSGYGSHPIFECPGNQQNDTPGSRR